MIVWTIQPLTTYEQLKKEKELLYKPSAEELELEELQSAYRWLGEQMQAYGMSKPQGAQQPWKAWYTYNGSNRVPDFKNEVIAPPDSESVLMQLEINPFLTLKYNYEKWHSVVNNELIINAKSDAEIERQRAHFERLDVNAQQAAKEESWLNIFNVHHGEQFVEVVFWKLRLKDLRSCRFLNVKKGEYGRNNVGTSRFRKPVDFRRYTAGKRHSFNNQINSYR